MPREEFRERNRKKREENAAATFYNYTRRAQIAEPKRSAERFAKEIHRGDQASRTASSASAGGDLAERTRAELYSRAQELEIEGRSQMNKDDLIDALREHGG
jgi:hypothetical protein